MKRRWTQFSLRSLFVLLLIGAVLLSLWKVYLQPYYREQKTIAELQKIAGELVPGSEPRGPGWLKRVAGGKYAQRVVYYRISSDKISDDDLANLRRFSHLEIIQILGAPRITDKGLIHLATIPTLWSLDLEDTQITNHGLRELRRLPNLETLGITSDQITDQGLVHLKELAQLESLVLECPVTDAGMQQLTSLKNLTYLKCGYGPARRVADRLSDPTQLKFDETPLIDVVEYLGDLHNEVLFRFDEQELDAAGVRLNEITVSMDTTGLRNPLRLREALHSLLQPLGLDFTVNSSGLVITTKDAAARRRTGIAELRKALPNLTRVDVSW